MIQCVLGESEGGLLEAVVLEFGADAPPILVLGLSEGGNGDDDGHEDHGEHDGVFDGSGAIFVFEESLQELEHDCTRFRRGWSVAVGIEWKWRFAESYNSIQEGCLTPSPPG